MLDILSLLLAVGHRCTSCLNPPFMEQLRLAGQEALNAKHPEPPSCGWSSLHFVLESAFLNNIVLVLL